MAYEFPGIPKWQVVEGESSTSSQYPRIEGHY